MKKSRIYTLVMMIILSFGANLKASELETKILLTCQIKDPLIGQLRVLLQDKGDEGHNEIGFKTNQGREASFKIDSLEYASDDMKFVDNDILYHFKKDGQKWILEYTLNNKKVISNATCS